MSSTFNYAACRMTQAYGNGRLRHERDALVQAGFITAQEANAIIAGIDAAMSDMDSIKAHWSGLGTKVTLEWAR